MADIAGWVALVATCVAALMTASNLGVRVTGWGFVIFTVGAAAWIVVGIVTHQTQLLYSNVFLGLVDLFGIWRWLGHRARISDTARAEEKATEGGNEARRFSVSKLDGLPLRSKDGEVIATAVDALAACGPGQIDFLLIRAGGVGGIGETLYRLPWSDARVGDDEIVTSLRRGDVSRLSVATPD